MAERSAHPGSANTAAVRPGGCDRIPPIPNRSGRGPPSQRSSVVARSCRLTWTTAGGDRRAAWPGLTVSLLAEGVFVWRGRRCARCYPLPIESRLDRQEDDGHGRRWQVLLPRNAALSTSVPGRQL